MFMIYPYIKLMKTLETTAQVCLPIKSGKGGRNKHADQLNRNTKEQN
jgi:hypothetical protein